jgi:hypothetical protein
VLARDGGICQIQGPRCSGVATTVDHIYPTSTHPHLFWAEENLRAACGRCNYGRSSSIQRETIADLRAQVEQQQQTIDRLLERLARYERANGRPLEPPMPAIY